MEEPDILTKSSRSDGAKRMWQRRKEKQKETENLPMQARPMREWIYHTEWVALMTTMIGCFLFVHSESVHTNERLDNHIEAINRRADQISADNNKRADELHKEFYELLKEMRNK
jgi:hypothetical protein